MSVQPFPSYRRGDVLTYATFDGTVRRVIVTLRDPDIKRGRPGFEGRLLTSEPAEAGICDIPNGSPVWGYDSQILSVEPWPAARREPRSRHCAACGQTYVGDELCCDVRARRAIRRRLGRAES